MWWVDLRISWFTQGLPTLSWPPAPNLLLPNLYHFGCYKKNNTNRFTQVLLCSWDGQIFFLQFLVVAECPTPFMGRTLSLPLKSCSYWCPDRRFFKTVSWGQTIFTSTKWNNAWMGEAIYGCLIKGSSDIKSADVKSRCDYTPLWDS